jgi:DNA-binding GntR family transcriptional regulator
MLENKKLIASAETNFLRNSLVDHAYQQLKQAIFAFHFLPGERFSENDVAKRLEISRTPVRSALLKLEKEGLVEPLFRQGWRVAVLDFAKLDALYDLRIVLERHALEKIVADLPVKALETLATTWLLTKDTALIAEKVFQQDEKFHATLVALAGNAEMLKVHQQITEKIRIVRRLDFSESKRCQLTYQEHATIVQSLLAKDAKSAAALLQAHILASKAKVHEITLQKLQAMREK